MPTRRLRIFTAAVAAFFAFVFAILLPYSPAARAEVPTNTAIEAATGKDSKGNALPAAPKSNVPPLAIPIPNVSLSAIKVDSDSGYIDVPWIAEYVTGAYKYAVGLATLLAMVIFMIGGFMYLTAGGDASRVSKAKTRITDAIVGLVLALGSYALLVVVNPNLTVLDTIRVKTVQRISFNDLTFDGKPMIDALPTPAAAGGGGGKGGPAACGPGGGTAVPAAACTRDFMRIDKIPGINLSAFKGGKTSLLINSALSQNLVELSQAVAERGSVMEISDTTRTQEGQFGRYAEITAACGNRYAGVPAPSNSCCATGHASGRAMDMKIDGSVCKMKDKVYVPAFMEQHGWVRLCVETWHYEIQLDHPSGNRESVGGSHCFFLGGDLLKNDCR